MAGDLQSKNTTQASQAEVVEKTPFGWERREPVSSKPADIKISASSFHLRHRQRDET